MTDQELAIRTVEVNRVELAARAQMTTRDPIERDCAQATLRQAVALRRVLEQWIVTRATRAPREHVEAPAAVR